MGLKNIEDRTGLVMVQNRDGSFSEVRIAISMYEICRLLNEGLRWYKVGVVLPDCLMKRVFPDLSQQSHNTKYPRTLRESVTFREVARLFCLKNNLDPTEARLKRLGVGPATGRKNFTQSRRNSELRKIARLNREINRMKNELQIDNLESERTNLRKTATQLESQDKELRLSLSTAEESVSLAEDAVDEARRELTTAEGMLTDAEDKVDELEKAITDNESELSDCQSDIENIEAQIADLRS